MQIDNGRVSEYQFAAKALQHGLVIGFPASEKLPYDFFLDNGKRIHKIQVKSTDKMAKDRNAYKVSTVKGRTKKEIYTKEEVDFIVCHIASLDTYYIIPVEHLNVMSINLYPHIKGKGTYEGFREAWHLLK
jgi:hypothetical protein